MKIPLSLSSCESRSILWAIDPLGEDPRPSSILLGQITRWAIAAHRKIQPIYLISIPSEKLVPYLSATGRTGYIEAAAGCAEDYLRALGVEGLEPVEVVYSGSPKRKAEVDTLVAYAERTLAPFIMVSSHGRAVDRWLMGSFAETLLLRARCPLFFMNDSAAPLAGTELPNRAMFATDFSDRSFEAFRRFWREIEPLGLEVCLFSSVGAPISVLNAGTYAPVVIPEDFFPKLIEDAHAAADRWMSLARARGVAITLTLEDAGFISHVAESILAAACRLDVGFIAMASLSGPFRALAMGSVARDIFRADRYPVFIYGPNACEPELSIPLLAVS